MKRFAELVNSWKGKPAIVIGGGTSAPSDFEEAMRLHPDSLHISANHHGFLLPGANCTYAVHIDKFHQHYQRSMLVVLKELKPDVILIGRHDFDDYYLVDWRYGGDTGVMALIVAQMMGAAPVVPCGFDRWKGGARPGVSTDHYFHPVMKHWAGPPTAPGLKRLVETVGSKAIRPVSGPMLEYFPKLGVRAEPDITALGAFQEWQTSSRVTRFAPILPNEFRRYRPEIKLRRMF